MLCGLDGVFLAATIRMAAGITMMIAYGHKVESEDDEFLAIADKGVATIEAAGAIGAHIVDFVPWRKSLVHRGRCQAYS